MDIPDELTLEIFDKASLEDLVNLCNTNSYYRGICNREFWERKFAQNQTFLVNPQSNPGDWANELLHSIASIEKARTILSDFQANIIYVKNPGDLYEEDAILTDFNNVNTVDIFPDFLDKKKINSLLLYSRVRHDEERRGGQIVLRNHLQPTIIFETYTEDNVRAYEKRLTEDQTLYLLFLFCYYNMRLYDVHDKTLYE
ncbi:F-box domain-containing protein [Brazilian cedratvirus IHUMI]|uniref:F-box domain-containing protein n=1 Tax=Brazilian cedratvirus IHUMI TaxID=2126980 RepID=A0A2R8FCX0_9VIRU|nr:F-box domain-containing protein [Brazilian cedratvirus IHUMI]